jgi:hypothetical protein
LTSFFPEWGGAAMVVDESRPKRDRIVKAFIVKCDWMGRDKKFTLIASIKSKSVMF